MWFRSGQPARTCWGPRFSDIRSRPVGHSWPGSPGPWVSAGDGGAPTPPAPLRGTCISVNSNSTLQLLRPKQLQIILDCPFPLMFHIQPTRKFYWFYFNYIPNQNTSHDSHCYHWCLSLYDLSLRSVSKLLSNLPATSFNYSCQNDSFNKKDHVTC